MQASKQAKPTAEFINTRAIDPTAAAVEKNARPLADRAVEEAVQPAAQAVAKNAEPTADRMIKEGIRPAAEVHMIGGLLHMLCMLCRCMLLRLAAQASLLCALSAIAILHKPDRC